MGSGEGGASARGNTWDPIDGRRHLLDIEAGRLATLAQRLGRRLRRGLAQLDQRNKLLAELDPLAVPEMPPEDWRETFKLYDKTITTLLKEQRERASLGVVLNKMRGGKEPLSEADYQAELAAIAQEHLLEMPAAEFDALRARRTAADVERDTKPGNVIDIESDAPVEI